MTLFYQLSFGTLVAVLLFRFSYNSPMEVTALLLLRKILCEVTLAGIADIVTLLIVRRAAGLGLERARTLSLQLSLNAVVSLAVSGAATLFLIGNLTNVRDRLTIVEDQIQTVVADTRASAPAAPLPPHIRVAGSAVELPLIVVPTRDTEIGRAHV